ncbi:MAG TPA: hypothetical protein VF120_14885 [Ktedonobacterales bacterium]
MAGIINPTLPHPAGGGTTRRGSIRHLGTLLGLAWTLRLRGYTRNWRAAIGLAFTLLFFLLPVGAGAALLTGLGYVALPRPAATQLLFGALLVLYIAWAALPLLQYSVNEGLDVTKLQIYPVTRTEQMLTLVLATLFDLTGLVILGVFAGVVIGWHATPLSLAVTLVALVFAYVHTVTLSQLLLAALMGMLRSRRYRDLSIIIFVVMTSACSLSAQILPRVLNFSNPGAVTSLRLDNYVWWTPPGMAAQAITQADAGNYAIAGAWLAALIALVPVLLYIWARVLDRGITTAEMAGAGGSRRTRRRASPTPAPASASTARPGAIPATQTHARRGLLSGAALAITGKDLHYFWRDPQMKAAVFSSLLVLVYLFIPFFFNSPDRANGFASNPFSPIQVLFAPLPALFITLSFSMNAFGYERAGAQTLFLLPVRPLDIFWGKNLAVATLAGVVGVGATIGIAALTGGWGYVPIALGVGLAGILVVLGCGNVISVLLPFRVRQMRMGQARFSSDNGCLRGLLSFVTMLLVMALLLPVVAAVAIPLFVGEPAWVVPALAGGILYGLLLYQLATRLIAPQVHRRAPDILAVVARDV